MGTYLDSTTEFVSTASGTRIAYRSTGDPGARPLLLIQHFRGNLDNWDPALIDALAGDRRVITFDNAGVASSSGTTARTVAAMARCTAEILEALDLGVVDVLGFSIGSFVAQELLLTVPDRIAHTVLASSAPQGASGMHGWSAEVMAGVGQRETRPEGYLSVFFAHSDTSMQAGREAAGRIFGRSANTDAPTTWATRNAQYAAVCDWGIPDHALLQRLEAVETPVFIANGDSDPMILPRYSHLLAGLIPDARLTIYPDSAHGFLFQHHHRFADDVLGFLG